jgi:hypothetical protein
LADDPARLELLKAARRLSTAIKSGPLGSGEYKLYRDVLWTAVALDRIAEPFERYEMKEDFRACRELASSLRTKVNPWLTPDGEEAVPAGPDLPFRLDALCNLPALCLPDLPWTLDGRLKATLSGLRSLSPSGGMLCSDGPAPGVSIRRNLTMALAMVRLGLPSALDYVESILRLMSGTYNFPETINPASGKGVSADGHDLMADALMALLVTDLFAFQEKGRLWITPIPALGWYGKGESIVVNGLSTDFGRFGYRVDGLADRVVLALKTEFSIMPERISFTVPFYPGKALADGVEMEVETRTLDFPPQTKKVVVYRQKSSD